MKIKSYIYLLIIICFTSNAKAHFETLKNKNSFKNDEQSVPNKILDNIEEISTEVVINAEKTSPTKIHLLNLNAFDFSYKAIDPENLNNQILDIEIDSNPYSSICGDVFSDTGILYAVSHERCNCEDESYRLTSINLGSGEVKTLYNVQFNVPAEFCSGLTWDPDTNNMYISTIDYYKGDSSLYTLDINTGSTQFIGEIDSKFVVGIAADKNGQLYGMEVGDNTFIKINKETAVSEMLFENNYPVGSVQGIDFDHESNMLYWHSCYSRDECGLLKKIDISNGTITDVGQITSSRNTIFDIVSVENKVIKTMPLTGLYFDRGRNGHGFAIEPIADSDLYFTVFYTYKEDGSPEWYTSLSSLENNVLNIDLSSAPDNGGLNRFIYDYSVDPTGAGNPNSIDSTIGISSLKIDFNSDTIKDTVACNDGELRGEGIALATWSLGNEAGEWCIEPLSNVIGEAPENNYGGTWWTGIDDDGWGLSLSFTSSESIIATIYYFDVEGHPRWTQGSMNGFKVGQEIRLDMLEFVGYGRENMPNELINKSTGFLSIVINENGVEGNIDLDISYQGEEGGVWKRLNMPVTIFSASQK